VKNKTLTHRILVVDDDLQDQVLLVQLLKQAIPDCHIDNAANGQEAMHYLEKAIQLPSLILLDIFMPLKDGFQVIEEVKNNPRLRPIPILALTVSSASTDILKSYNLGVNAYLVKPATEEELNQFVQTIYVYWLNNVVNPVQRLNNF